jgi:iron-sulfur cluster assembly protein
MAITITEKAKSKISEILKKRQTPNDYLRISLKGGGCSGYIHSYEFIKEPQKTDKVFDFDSVKVCIDIKSYMFLNGMEIDYQEDLFKSGIVLNIPSVTRTCGCGESMAF